MRKDAPTVILIALMVMFACGALLTYPLNPNEFKAEVNHESAIIEVEMNSTIESAYSVFSVDMKNGNNSRELYSFYDEAYESPLGLGNQDYRINEIDEHLNYLNVKNSRINAESLKTILLDTSNAKNYAILMCSGAFPCNTYAYNGTAYTVDLVSPWINAGGVILWYSTQEFGYYSSPLKEDFVDWETNQPLDHSYSIFELQFEESTAYASERSEISSLLTLTQNICDRYSVKGTSSNIKNLGYESDDGRYSIAQVDYGMGSIVVNGGSWTSDMSMAKIIASMVYDWVDYSQPNQSGTFKGTKTLEFNDLGIDAIFVYMGTITPRYGELFLL